MNVFILYAHPEPRSLNGSLNTFMVDHLQQAGHVVQVSDLHAMGWKAELDGKDFPQHPPAERLDAAAASLEAYTHGTQSPDVAAEQRKLLWADTVILQFPLWWFSMPAILKGWVDRVYARGFAYGVGEHSDKRWGNRYGEGIMFGKRAMLVVTTGGWESHYSARGINGPMDDLLYPIQHGMLYYPGFEVLPPFIVHRTSKVDEAKFAEVTRALAQRLDTLTTTPAIAYRRQNAGDYEIPAMTLRPDLAPGSVGMAMHVATPGEAQPARHST